MYVCMYVNAITQKGLFLVLAYLLTYLPNLFRQGKVAGCSGLPIDRIKHLGVSGVDMMHEILKRVWEEEQMPEEWKKSEIVPHIQAQGGPTRMWEL